MDNVTDPSASVADRLSARPDTPTRAATVGTTALGLGSARDGLLYVPEGYDPGTPAPLLVLLHGSGGAAAEWTSVFDSVGADGVVVLAVDSRGETWDRVWGDFGPDVEFLDEALAETFDQVAVDPTRIALAGFSDGGSYALSLGVGNGDLFTHLIAFSPAFINSGDELVGRPAVFIAHGTQDAVVPLESSRDYVIPLLEAAGYEVEFQAFAGGHVLPFEVFDGAMTWFLE